MNGTDFERAAATATLDAPFDAGATLAAVRASHRRRTRVRRAAVGVPVAAALAVAAVAAPSIVAPTVTTSTATAAYRFDAAPADVPAIATLDRLSLHYLPTGFDPLPTPGDSDASYQGGSYTSHRFDGPDGQEVNVTITQIPGLTIDSYLTINWFDDPQTTTVGDRAAFVNQVSADGASGLIFSPEDGVVVELHTDTERGDDLRTIVEHMSW